MSQGSLQQALLNAKRQRFHSYSVYIPILHLHLVNELGLLLPPEHWDRMNLGYFLKPNSYTALQFPAIRLCG